MERIDAGEVRPFRASDTGELLALMRGLAEVEGYADDFDISEQDLIERGLSTRPDFRAYVVPRCGSGELLGMAVTYRINWTYAGRPNVVLKELFVREDARGVGVGHSLMQAVLDEARQINAYKLLWTVLPNNRRARLFYSSFGAVPDAKWQSWEMLL